MEYTREFGGNDGTILYPDYGRHYMTLCICQIAQNCTLKNVNLTISKFYPDKLDPLKK